jgi:hypothetical protein
MATSLKHPNIAAVLDFAIDDKNTFYMVMEFIDGINLSEYLAQEGIPPAPISLEIAIQSLKALGFLHRSGIVHRDISPDNLMLAEDSEGRLQVKLIDLGVAKRIEGQGLTQVSGMFVGKLQYASPEQMGKLEAGEKIDGRSDIYSFGCVLYRTMTGRHAYVAEGIEQFLMAHLMKPPRSFEDTDPEGFVPEGVRVAIMKALRKNRNERWNTAEEFADELRRCQQLLTAATPQASPTSDTFVIGPAHPEVGARERQTGVSAVERQLQEIFPVSPVPGVGTAAGKGGGTQATKVGQGAGTTGRTVARPTQATQLNSPAASSSKAEATVAPTFITAPAEGSGKTSRKPPVALWAGIAAAVVLLVAGGVYLVRGRSATKGTEGPPPTVVPVGTTGTLSLSVNPWAKIESLTNEETGAQVPLLAAETPIRMPLPAGRYSAKLSYKGTVFEVPLEIRSGELKVVQAEAPGFDVAQAVRAYVP